MTVLGLVAFLRAVPDATYKGIADADPDAVGELVRTSAECRACHRHLDAIADLAAELLTTISTDLGRIRLKEIANPRAYFAVALMRRVRMADTSSRLAPCSLDDVRHEPVDVAAVNPEVSLIDREQHESLGRAIGSLGLNGQFVVTALLRGASYREIAAEMQRTRGRAPAQSALRKEASRAIRKLAAFVAPVQ